MSNFPVAFSMGIPLVLRIRIAGEGKQCGLFHSYNPCILLEALRKTMQKPDNICLNQLSNCKVK
jgi:hypothetical protein